MKTLLLALLGFASVSTAGTLATDFTALDSFDFYVTTDLTTPGASIASGTGSVLTATGLTGIALTDNVTNYILVKAHVGQGTGMFMGDFTLSGGDFRFANQSQFLVTNSTVWGANQTGFTDALNAVTDLGTTPSMTPEIDAAAHWIWSNPTCTNCDVYFVAAIEAVPEPASFVMVGAGALLGLVYRRARR